ncbi:MAG: hypothetical protein AAGU14_06540, partial [Eubacteriaceae bacterium]
IILNIIGVILQDFAEIRMILYALLLIIIMIMMCGESPWIIKMRNMLNIKKFNFKGRGKAGA